jgi:hypothetical protein
MTDSKYLCFLLLVAGLAFNSCKTNNKVKVDNYQIANKVNLIFSKDDSLARGFMLSDFKKTVDTLNFTIKESPNKISLTEYLCRSCYSVSQTKILMLAYNSKASVYLFKYDKGLNTWRIKTYREISNSRFIVLNNKIIKNSDWVTRKKYNPQHTLGDVLRYHVYSDSSKITSTMMAYDPSSELLDKLANTFK